MSLGDPDDVGAALALPVEPFEGVRRPEGGHVGGGTRRSRQERPGLGPTRKPRAPLRMTRDEEHHERRRRQFPRPQRRRSATPADRETSTASSGLRRRRRRRYAPVTRTPPSRASSTNALPEAVPGQAKSLRLRLPEWMRTLQGAKPGATPTPAHNRPRRVSTGSHATAPLIRREPGRLSGLAGRTAGRSPAQARAPPAALTCGADAEPDTGGRVRRRRRGRSTRRIPEPGAPQTADTGGTPAEASGAERARGRVGVWSCRHARLPPRPDGRRAVPSWVPPRLLCQTQAVPNEPAPAGVAFRSAPTRREHRAVARAVALVAEGQATARRGWSWRVLIERRDLWVGLFWDRRPDGLHVWVCPLPTVAVHGHRQA